MDSISLIIAFQDGLCIVKAWGKNACFGYLGWLNNVEKMTENQQL
jgi:hypothetical protein